MDVSVVLLAAGCGERLGSVVPKAFIRVFPNKLLLDFSLEVFESVESISSVLLVVPEAYKSVAEEWVSSRGYKKVSLILVGGKTRQESSCIGCMEVSSRYVLIHDVARPFISEDLVQRVISFLRERDAVCPVVPVVDTLVSIDGEDVCGIVDRRKTVAVQTPQGFLTSVIQQAHALAKKDKHFVATDDISLILRYGLCGVRWVEGARENLKITYPQDLEKFRWLGK